MGTRIIRERGEDNSDFFLLDRSIMGSWVLIPALCQGAFVEGDESSWNDKAAFSSRVHVSVSWCHCCNSIWNWTLWICWEVNLNNVLMMQGPSNKAKVISINSPNKGNIHVYIWIPIEERRLESHLGPWPTLCFKSSINRKFVFRIWRSSSTWLEVLIYY